MNKRQKEVIQAQLDSEKAVLEQLEKHYTRALNDIDKKIRILQSDELTQSRIYRLEYQKALKEQVKGVLEKLHSDEYTTIQQFLSASYTDAFVGTAYDLFGQGVPLIMPIDPEEAVKAVLTDSKINGSLYESLGVDVNKLKKTISSEISRGIAGGMSYNEIARNISSTAKAPMARAKTIVQTESHRIQQAARHNARVTAKSKGADIVKQWNSTLDGGTRDTHRKLDGQIRELDEPFEVGGMKAMYPGDFGDPAEDCNCRCEALQRAKWALGEAELETLKERAKYFGLDKTKDFESFKTEYIKAAQTIEKAEKSSKIVLSDVKLSGYALNPDIAPDKAAAFEAALGYTAAHADLLKRNVMDHIDESKFVEKGDKGYGMRYEYIMELTGLNGKKANVLTAWIQDGEKKRLTSIYVTKRAVTK